MIEYTTSILSTKQTTSLYFRGFHSKVICALLLFIMSEYFYDSRMDIQYKYKVRNEVTKASFADGKYEIFKKKHYLSFVSIGKDRNSKDYGMTCVRRS